MIPASDGRSKGSRGRDTADLKTSFSVIIDEV